jgi:predicted patatin/cPLA2 family phospholipase
MLPEGTALVLEGGGTRGFYSAGVFDAFMAAGIMFPYIIGVSAGAANVLSYVSGQRGRNRVIVERYVGRHEYVSKRNLLRGSMFGFDFIFNTIPEKHIFFDREALKNAPVRMLCGALNCENGRTVWFEKPDFERDLLPVRASCSVPIISPMVKFGGYNLLDGGLADPIPIEKSIADGNKFHVIVLTKNKGYIPAPFANRHFLKMFYRKYPEVVKVLLRRHEVYARQLAKCDELEAAGNALIIRPQNVHAIGRTTSDTAKLLALYDDGQIEGAAVTAWFKKSR